MREFLGDIRSTMLFFDVKNPLLSKGRFFLAFLLILLLSSAVPAEVVLSCSDEGFETVRKVFPEVSSARRVPVEKNMTPLGISVDGLNSRLVQGIARECSALNLHEGFVRISMAINGPVKTGDAKLVDDILHGVIKPFTVLVYLNSPGGEVYEAMRIGRLFASNEVVNTTVSFVGVCASACVLLLAGGDFKYIAGGKVAIHRVELGNHAFVSGLTQDNYRKIYDSAMEGVGGYFKEMGVRPELADEMMRYSSDDAHVLTEDEIKYYRLDQRNPYRYEKEKSWWIAHCGKDWWKLKQTLTKTTEDKCKPLILKDREKFKECFDSIMDPLYKLCEESNIR